MSRFIDWAVQQWPILLSFFFTFLVVANRLAEESKKFAGLFGPIGRAMYRRAQNRTKVDPESIAQAIEKARHEWESEENEALAAVNHRLDTVTSITTTQSGEIAELKRTIHTLTAYTVYEARWHQVFSISNPGVDAPEHLDWLRFEQKYTDDPNGAWRHDIIRAQAAISAQKDKM